MNKLKGYRTLLFNLASAVVLIGGAMTGQVENPETLRYIAIAIVVANGILRMLTTGPVAQK